MNLQTHINEELWLAISNPYSTKNYKNAILEAMHLLTNVLRERAEVDGDGVSLAHQALGGDTPKLKINEFQTQSEKDEQKGVLHLIMGLYEAIRNPRSHEQGIEDSVATADAVIIFIDYLLDILRQSKPPFTLEEFLERVFDEDFVASEKYARLLLSEVPRAKYFELLVEIFRQKLDGDGNKLKYMVDVLVSELDNEKSTEFMRIVSEELKTTKQEAEIRRTLQILSSELWPRIDEIARLRIENKLITSIAQGEFSVYTGCNSEGAFGTWARRYLTHFSLKAQAANVMVKRLEDTWSGRLYILQYFAWILPDLLGDGTLKWRAIEAIASDLRNNDEVLEARIKELGWGHSWYRDIMEAQSSATLDDEEDIPF